MKQANRNSKIEYMGEKKTISQWVRHLGIPFNRTWWRIYKNGWTIQEAFTLEKNPLSRRSKHCPHGHPYNEENTNFYRGRRLCRTCSRAKDRGRKYIYRYRTYTSERYKEIRRKSSARWIKENKEKVRAYSLVNQAIKKGVLLKQPCTKCGETKVHAHHTDYTKPLDVMWLCSKHHKEIHHEK